MASPLGIANNNPGNLRWNLTDKWQGLDPVENSAENHPEFFVFKDPVYGIRAMARTLIAYQDNHNCKTITDFITRWAPPTDNNPTATYIAFVAQYMEITATAPINMHQYSTLRPMIEAIIQQENGGKWDKYYTSDQLDKALVLAGVEPPQKSLITTPQIAAGAVAVAATVAPPLMDQIHQMQTLIQPYISQPLFHYASIGLALAGMLYTMWAKYDERQKGIS